MRNYNHNSGAELFRLGISARRPDALLGVGCFAMIWIAATGHGWIAALGMAAIYLGLVTFGQSELGTARKAQRDDLLDRRTLELIARRTQTAIVVTDPQGLIEWANEGFCRLSGYALDEVKGRRPGSFLQGPETDGDTVLAMGAALRAGQGWRGEVVNYRKNGERYLVHLHIEPIVGDSGEMLGYTSVEEDVTIQHDLARQLAEKEVRLRTLIETTDVILWESDVQLERFSYVSPQVELLGYRQSEAMARGFWSSVIHCEDRESVEEERRSAAHDESHQLLYRVVEAKGESRWIRESAFIDEDQDGNRVLRGVFVDVNPQKLAAERLREISDRSAFERDRLELALAGGDLGLWDWNPQTDEIYFDDHWGAAIGLMSGKLPQTMTEWKERMHPADVEQIETALESHFEGRRMLYECSIRMLSDDGSWLWILTRGGVVSRDSAGIPIRMVGTHLDITEHREREAQLAELRDAALMESQVKSEFLANMSHEIRTPLTAILGYTDLLSDDDVGNDAARRADALKTIRGAGRHLLTILNDILDLSKIEAGKMTVEKVMTDVSSILLEVESVMRPNAELKGIQLETRLDDPIPARILSDPTRLRQILMNLVGNATKFTLRGKVLVEVSTRWQEGGGGWLRLCVEDTGPGMSKNQANNLFSPFQQADSTVARNFGGTGLGLSISRRLAHLMGGDISVLWSRVDEGTCFLVELPLDRIDGDVEMIHSLQSVAPNLASASRVHHVTLGGRILLAEDSPVNQRLFEVILARAGAHVEVVSNGCQALLAIDRATDSGEAYDLLLTDIHMPEMDGYMLARTLRNRGSKLAIVALTADAMAEDRLRCLDAGCDDYASKPINKQRLLETCAKWIGKVGGIAPKEELEPIQKRRED